MDMDQEIRDSHGGDLQDNIESAEGTYKWAPTQPEIGSAGESPSDEGAGGGGQEFPRASEGEVIEAAERAKAQFGGTYEGGGKGPESAADEGIAKGEKPGPFQQAGENPAADAGGGNDAPSAEDVKERAEAGDDLTTGQKLAGIMASDPNMQAESKIVSAMSGGDEEEAEGNA